MQPGRPSSTPFTPFYRLAFASALTLCASCTPDAATTNRRAAGDRFDPTVVLEGPAAASAERGMAGPAAGYQARPLVSAADGVRWEDVEMAITNVSKKSFVGVTAYDRTADRVVGTTVLADGQRGSVVAERGATGAIAIHAKLGTFADASRDRSFEEAVLGELRRLGAIARPQVTP